MFKFKIKLNLHVQEFSCCATLLPVKYFQISGDRKIFLKSGQNFTSKSVAQASVPGCYF